MSSAKVSGVSAGALLVGDEPVDHPEAPAAHLEGAVAGRDALPLGAVGAHHGLLVPAELHAAEGRRVADGVHRDGAVAAVPGRDVVEQRADVEASVRTAASSSCAGCDEVMKR